MADGWDQLYQLKMESLKQVLKDHIRALSEDIDNIYIIDEGWFKVAVLQVWANHTINYGLRMWNYAKGIAVMRGHSSPSMEDVYLAFRMAEIGLDHQILLAHELNPTGS